MTCRCHARAGWGVVDKFGWWTNKDHTAAAIWSETAKGPGRPGIGISALDHLAALDHLGPGVAESVDWMAVALNQSTDFFLAAYERLGPAMARVVTTAFGLSAVDRACVFRQLIGYSEMWEFRRDSFKVYSQFGFPSPDGTLPDGVFPLPTDPDWVVYEESDDED